MQNNNKELQQYGTAQPNSLKSMRPSNMTFDMMMDADSELSMAVTTDDVKSKKLQVLQQADKDNIDSLSKKLLATRQELEDLKQKFGALKRNYDAITQHAAKDNVEFVRLQKMKDEYENQLNNLKQANSKLSSDMNDQKKLQDEL